MCTHTHTHPCFFCSHDGSASAARSIPKRARDEHGLAGDLVQQLRGKLSDRGLSEALEQHGVSSRWRLGQDTQLEAEAALRGLDVPLASGSTEHLWVVDPIACMHLFVRARPSFASVMDHAIGCWPASHTFRWILYYDELTIGNPLCCAQRGNCWFFTRR